MITILVVLYCPSDAFGRLSSENEYSPPLKKPNVLFIAIDNMNDWVGCLCHYTGIKTPNIDKLAKRGILFTNAHCSAPACVP